ncbi:MAG: DUF2442 domain-containing protein [Thioploca sp.]|nr:DUF2442 domain-containing protein [Thioploca sp.]
MSYPKIKSARAIDEHTLLVEFTNADKRKYDVTPLLDKERFFPLKQRGFFRNFQIDSTGCALIWNEDIDISEYEIWLHGVKEV